MNLSLVLMDQHGASGVQAGSMRRRQPVRSVTAVGGCLIASLMGCSAPQPSPTPESPSSSASTVSTRSTDEVTGGAVSNQAHPPGATFSPTLAVTKGTLFLSRGSTPSGVVSTTSTQTAGRLVLEIQCLGDGGIWVQIGKPTGAVRLDQPCTPGSEFAATDLGEVPAGAEIGIEVGGDDGQEFVVRLAGGVGSGA